MKRDERVGAFLIRNEKRIALLLIAVGALIRVLYLGTYPGGLNQDEASAGYEAFALMNYGIDRNGSSWPVLFISWGSGQNVLYSYLSMPFIALFGLNTFSVRIVEALFGTATLAVFWLLARRLRGEAFGLTALFILTVNPWQIMLSRWALESNLLPFFLLLGLYFMVVSAERPYALIGSAAAFALSLYAYGTAFIFLLFFLPLAAAVMLWRRQLKLRALLPAAAVFIAIAAPITLCNLLNALGRGTVTVFGITLPALTQPRQLETTVLDGSGLTGIANRYFNLISLLVTQNDGMLYNSIPGFGVFYYFGLPSAAVGLYVSIVGDKPRGKKAEIFVTLALAASFVSACLIDININRINMLFLPLIYFSALGVHTLVRKLRKWGAAVLAGIVVYFAVFVGVYFTSFNNVVRYWFFDGLGEAIEYASALDAAEIYVSETINAPYIYVLFYEQTDPNVFFDTVRYLNPCDAFREVYSFGKYRFYGPDRGADTVSILTKGMAREEGFTILAEFGNYAVARAPD